VHDLFEGASLPGISEADARHMLRLVICGGGPTGAELAAELRDLIDADLTTLYPHLAPLAEVCVESNMFMLASCSLD
jgi:NADH:ubiquinone reductase (non-electrogenic)